MPTYEFRCPKGHEFEKFYRTISGAEAQAACPVCGETAERMMSAAGFAFKGSGFYLTDYGKNAHRDKGNAPKATGESSTTDGATSKAESKAESSKGTSSDGGTASTSSPGPAPAAESKPVAPPKKSSGE